MTCLDVTSRQPWTSPQGQADDVRAQEIIAREVHDLMRTSGPIHEGHLSILEERIRSALSGKTPPPLSLSLQRQQVRGGMRAPCYWWRGTSGLLLPSPLSLPL